MHQPPSQSEPGVAPVLSQQAPICLWPHTNASSERHAPEVVAGTQVWLIKSHIMPVITGPLQSPSPTHGSEQPADVGPYEMQRRERHVSGTVQQ